MEISQSRLQSTVESLAAFPTRNTMTPGHREAAEWLAEQYRAIPGLQVELMEYVLQPGKRVPEPTPAVQVVATLLGRSSRRILVGGHFDSLNLQGQPHEVPAPGANDDASGTAVALEMAHLMAEHAWENTLVFVGFSGEEQGLQGARALASRARAENWEIDAVLNNDTVGSSSNLIGQSDPHQVRVFSDEGAPRELARWIEWVARQELNDFGVKLVLRKDRFGRGGDHTPFAEAGFPAVRFIEVHEEFARQHTPDDLPEAMDFEYLANVARVNLHALVILARAEKGPTNVRIERADRHSARLTWEGPDLVTVYWRETTSAGWQSWTDASGFETVVEKVNIDDHIFAVGAKEGFPVQAR
jgi:Zn-dependent M28 family amino/carboxypeptidase